MTVQDIMLHYMSNYRSPVDMKAKHGELPSRNSQKHHDGFAWRKVVIAAITASNFTHFAVCGGPYFTWFSLVSV